MSLSSTSPLPPTSCVTQLSCWAYSFFKWKTVCSWWFKCSLGRYRFSFFFFFFFYSKKKSHAPYPEPWTQTVKKKKKKINGKLAVLRESFMGHIPVQGTVAWQLTWKPGHLPSPFWTSIFVSRNEGFGLNGWRFFPTRNLAVFLLVSWLLRAKTLFQVHGI